METTPAVLRDRAERRHRLDEEWLHLFSLQKFAAALRQEPDYERNGHNGLILMKTEHMRVVLEVARAGSGIGEHTIHGPALVQVIEGSLVFQAGDERRDAHAGEMVVIPHERPRTIRASEDAAFLWALALDSRGDAPAERRPA
jgi:quercetin dioxygenase-like cupin family protein